DLVTIYQGSDGQAYLEGQISDSSRFYYGNRVHIGAWSSDNKYYAMDVDGDGITDIAQLYNNQGKGYVQVWTPKHTDSGYIFYSRGERFLGCWGDNCRYYSIDLNGDGSNDLIELSKSPFDSITYMSTFMPPKCLSTIRNGMGGTIDISYHNRGYIINPGESNYPVINDKTHATFVSSVTKTDGSGGSYISNYEYSNAKVYTGFPYERKNLYFETVTELCPATETRRVVYYKQDPVFRGKPLRVQEFAKEVLVKDITYEYEDNTSTPFSIAGEGTTTLTRLKSVTIKTYNTDKSLLLTTVSENLERDSFGNITLSKLTKIPAGSTSKSYYEARNFINQTDSGNWIIGLPESFDKYVNDSSNYDNIITKETYEYNNKFQPLKIRAWFINQQGEVTWAETINEYYTNGLLQSTTTPDNIKTVYTYGSENIIEVFPLADVSKKITRTLRKDYRYGKTSQYTNEHGFRAVIERDEFGRETGAVLYEGASGPENGSKIRESFTEYQFNDDGESYIQVCTKYGDFFDGDVCRRTYYNGLLRNYKTITPAVEGDTDSGRYTAQYIKYDSAGRSAQISDSYYTGLDASLPGESIKWTNKEFDSLGRIARITIPGNNDRVIEYNYNNDLESGLVGSETVIQKNPLNDLMDIQKQVFYNIDGKPVRIIEDKDGINVLSRFEYDTLGRLIKTIVADKETIIEYYRGTGLQKSITDPNAGKTEYTYFDTPGDPRFGSLEKETRPAPNGPGFITITNEYNDPYGRLTGQVSPDRTVGFHYDDYESYTGDPGSFGVGRLTYSSITTDEYKLTTKYDYDIFGETVKVTRDIEDDILCTGDAVGMPCHAEIGRELDRLGRTRKTVYPDDSEIEYSYFGGSGIINKITEGDTVHAAYSGINKRAQAGVIEYGNQVKTVFSYKTDGFLDDMKTSLEDKTYLHYSYDFYNNGNIRAITDHLNYQESAGAIDLSVQYSYDAMNRISSVTQNSETLNYEFDGNSGSTAGRGNLTGKAGSSLEYYPGSTKVRSITNTSGSTTNYSWSTSGNLLSKSNPSSSFSYTYNSENMLEKSEGDKGETKFYYDDTGQRFLKIYDNREGTVIKTYSSGIYEYRIKLIDGTVDEVKGTKYIIGANGKVLAANTKDLTGAVSSTGVQIPDEVKKKSGLINGFMDKISNSIKQFAGISFNDLFLPAFVLILLSFITIISARNIFGLVLSINRSGTLEKGSRRLVSFCIGNKTFTLGINRKGKRVTGFASRHPVYAHIALVCSLLTLSLFGCGQDIVVPGGVSMPPEYGGLPVGTLYFHTNHLGSSALITDEEGNEVSRVNYLPYGEVQKEYSGVYNQGNGFIEDASGSVSSHFTGQQYDYESGLYYYNARYYDPGAGAFTSADSIIPDPGSSLAYNRHMYVAGNPVMFADPTGHSWDGLKDFVMGIALFFVDPHDDGVSLGLGDLVGINISWGGESGNGGSIYIGDKDGNFAGIGYYNNRGPDEHYFLIGAGMGAKPSAPEQTDPFNRPLPPPPSSGDKDSGGSKDGGGSSVIDGVQIGLDALGMVPVVGFVFDIVNAGVSAFRGNWGDAAFSLGAAIPGIGQGIGAAKMIKAGVKAGVAATSLVKKMDTARKLGKAGEEAAGIYKNTKRIMKGTATGVNYRIPDGLTKKVVQEVKNVSRLSNTRQLRDYARFAKDTGRRFELFIRPTTKMSGPLLDAITNGDIFLRFLP
ncbi:MAG: hypothetical protein GY754_46640, partial [bacterium]|nr:hypothetical protein [bacterium]